MIAPSVKVISFDLDDTLWDGMKVILHAESAMLNWMNTHTPIILENLSQSALRDKKIQFIKAHPHLKNKISAVRRQFLQQLFSEFGYENSESLAHTCFDTFYAARQQVVLFDDVMSTLHVLKKQYRLIAITNGNADINAVGLAELFEFCLVAENFDQPKPAPEIFHHGLSLLGCDACEVLHVGDHPIHDMQGANDVGMKTAWLKDGSREWPHAYQPDMTIGHIKELL